MGPICHDKINDDIDDNIIHAHFLLNRKFKNVCVIVKFAYEFRKLIIMLLLLTHNNITFYLLGSGYSYSVDVVWHVNINFDWLWSEIHSIDV